MSKTILVLFVSLSCFCVGASAADNDPGFGEGRPVYSEQYGYGPLVPLSDGRRVAVIGRTNDWQTPTYYRPTQRYYGPGYTVSYRFVPVYKTDSRSMTVVTGAANFRVESFHLSPADVAAAGAGSPRMTVKDPKSGAPRTAVTSIVRKKSKLPAKPPVEEIPVIVPDAGAPTPTSTGSPAKP